MFEVFGQTDLQSCRSITKVTLASNDKKTIGAHWMDTVGMNLIKKCDGGDCGGHNNFNSKMMNLLDLGQRKKERYEK